MARKPTKIAIEQNTTDQQVEVVDETNPPVLPPVEPTPPVDPTAPPIYTRPRSKSKGQIALYVAAAVVLLAIIVAIL